MARSKDSRELRAIIRAAQDGDEHAFEQILVLVERPAFRLALSMLRRREDAEDALQETMIKLWRTLPAYRFECPILPYVLRMTRTTVLDMLRRTQGARENEISLTVENEEGEPVTWDVADPDPASNPVQSYERDERIRAVRAAMSQLPQKYREILSLKEIQGYSYESLCQVLGLEKGTVKSRLARARKKLAEILIKNGNIF
jgi:RNA polymerase sigma-70 factor (ECF subfamily)